MVKRLLVIAFALAGCHRATLRFACATDGQCGATGRCVAGACALPATDCPSGLRFDNSAGDLAGQCIEALCGGPSGPPPSNAQGVARCAIGAAPTIDGNLSDWPDSLFQYLISHKLSTDPMVHSSNNWSPDENVNNADLSASFAVRWDLANLYVAVRIVDDIRGVHPQAISYALWADDAVELFLDGDHDRSVGYGDEDYQFYLIADHRTALAKNGPIVGGQPADSVVMAADAPGRAANWNLEISIPWKALGSQPASHGRQIGFDLQLDDDDTRGGPMQMQVVQHQLLWQYQGPTSCATCCQPFCSTQYFGTIELSGP